MEIYIDGTEYAADDVGGDPYLAVLQYLDLLDVRPDDEVEWMDYSGMARYGRRLVMWDDSTIRSYVCTDVDTAVAAFHRIAAYTDDENDV